MFSVLCGACADLVVAQSRAALVGRVLDGEGEHVASAEVLLVHRVLPFAVGADELDLPGDEVLRVRTGEDGRFRVEVQEGRGYSGYAFWTDAAGQQHGTLQQEDLVAGSYTEFEEPTIDHGPMPMRIRIEGLDAWAGLGPFRYRIVPYLGHPIALPVSADPTGLLVSPPLPGNRGGLEILTANGEVLYAIRIGSPERGPDGQAVPTTVSMPPPMERRLRVVAAAASAPAARAPIAGATVRVRSVSHSHPLRTFGADDSLDRSAWRTLGVTDADGRLSVQVPTRGGADDRFVNVQLVVLATGRATVHAGWMRGRPYVAGAVLDDEALRELVVPLPAAQPIHGVVRDESREPMAGAVVYLRTWFERQGEDGISVWTGPGLLARTDATGRFEFADAAASYHQTGLFVVPPPTWRLGAAENDPPRPDWLAPLAANVDPKDHRRLGAVDLERLRAIGVTVLDDEGRPVRGARIDSVLTNSGSRSEQPHAWTDGRGRAQLRVTREARRLLLVTHPTVGCRGLIADHDDLVVQLEPYFEIVGRVVDRSGDPVAGADVDVRTSQSLRAPGELRGMEHSLDSMLDDRNRVRSAETGADGRFRLRMLPTRGRRVGFTVSGLGLQAAFEVEWPVDAGEGAGAEPGVALDVPLDVGDVLLGPR